jgi:tetratricopeptide (TPR) repeat protein
MNDPVCGWFAGLGRCAHGHALARVWYCCHMKRENILRLFKALTVAVLLTIGSVGAWADAGEEAFDRGYESFVARDYEAAMQWWKKAAEQEHARAQNGLGVLYRDGDLGTPDPASAAKWFRRSAENGYAFAMFSLALLYRDGEGVAQDDIEAYKWFDLASALNFDPRALFQRDLIARRMTSEQVAEAQKRAQEWLNAFFFGGASA